VIQTVLVVDDDDALREMVGLVLAGAGYEPMFAADGISAVEVFTQRSPDLVLLDVMLPGQSGIEVCKQIRAISGVPIVMLTAKGDTEDVVLGLEAGADDYVVKPHKGAELLARVKARLRPLPEDSEVLQVAGLFLDSKTFEVNREGVSLSLTPLEFKLLHTLAAKPQQCLVVKCCWSRFGVTSTRLTPDWSTFTSSGFAPK